MDQHIYTDKLSQICLSDPEVIMSRSFGSCALSCLGNPVCSGQSLIFLVFARDVLTLGSFGIHLGILHASSAASCRVRSVSHVNRFFPQAFLKKANVAS